MSDDALRLPEEMDRIFKKTTDEKPVDDVVDPGDNTEVNIDSF